MHVYGEQVAKRIDEDVTFTTGQALAPVKSTDPLFSVVLAT